MWSSLMCELRQMPFNSNRGSTVSDLITIHSHHQSLLKYLASFLHTVDFLTSCNEEICLSDICISSNSFNSSVIQQFGLDTFVRYKKTVHQSAWNQWIDNSEIRKRQGEPSSLIFFNNELRQKPYFSHYCNLATRQYI